MKKFHYTFFSDVRNDCDICGEKHWGISIHIRHPRCKKHMCVNCFTRALLGDGNDRKLLSELLAKVKGLDGILPEPRSKTGTDGRNRDRNSRNKSNTGGGRSGSSKGRSNHRAPNKGAGGRSKGTKPAGS